MIRFRSFRSRLQTALLLLGLTAVGLTAWEALAGATSALRSATFERLTAIRETKGRQIERYFQDVGNHVLALSTDESTVAALEQFIASWQSIPPVPASGEHFDVLQRFYKEPSTATDWFPDDPRTRALQLAFIVQNPYPAGGRFHLLTAPQTGAYSRVHARYHPTLHRYLSAFGFYDIFLIGGKEGRILYTVMKEVDLGTALSEAPYKDTALASAWRRAMELTEVESFAIEDYSPYLPSNLAPAAFVAAPIYRAGTKIGVLAIQLSISEVNRVMTADRRWKEEGLGETGQAYVVGEDGALRSDLRPEIENPEEFYSRLLRSGTRADVVDRIRRYRTAVLNLQVATGQNGVTGPETPIATNLQGARVLRSEAPLELPGLRWRVIAEIDAEEALAPVAALRWRIIWQGLAIAAGLVIAARWLAKTVSRPVLSLAESAHRLGEHDFAVRLTVRSEDEIGQLAESFNRMAENLERTTVSKQELDRMLGSLINAVFVIDASRNSMADAVLSAPVRLANRAGLEMLGYDDGDIPDLTLEKMLAPDGRQWHRIAARLFDEGRAPSMQAVLTTKSGEPVPVLLTASWLEEEHGKHPGIVCAAQDISEWKRTQDKLREKQQELELLTERLIAAQEEERSRLARELHDDLTQRLAAVAIEAGWLESIGPGETERWRPMLDRIKREMADLSKDIHGLSRRLHPSTLDDLGLVAGIESECRAFFERGGPPVEFSHSGPFTDLPKETQLGMYRIVQESLRNIARHSHADDVRIDLQRFGSEVRLEIADNGRGFDRSAPQWRAGLGLASMEERTRLLGGRFAVESAPGTGARISVVIPLGEARGETESSTG